MKRLEVSCVISPALLPVYRTVDSSGADLHAGIREQIRIGPGERVSIPTGLRLEIPRGYEAQIRPRSGLALAHGVTVLNSPGTIDADYRGEVRVILINLGRDPFLVKPGDRIAQLVFGPIARARFNVRTRIAASDRGEGGFGSTET